MVTSDLGAVVNVTSSRFIGNAGFSGGAVAVLVSTAPYIAMTHPAFVVQVVSSEFIGNIAGPNEHGIASALFVRSSQRHPATGG